jgi:Domain of unknown function (DUF4129)
VPVIAAVALLLVMVALASRPEAGTVSPGLGYGPARVALDTLFYMMAVAGLAGVLIAVWALWPDPEIDMQPIERPRWPMGVAVVAALTVLGLVWWRNNWGRLPYLGGLGYRGGGASLPGQLTLTGPRAGQGTDWIAIAITVMAIGAVAVLAWRTFRPPRRRVRPVTRVGAALAELFDDAVDDVIRERDPRRAVIAAWARMERLLARQGLARHPAEAPFEYAERAFAELGLLGTGLAEFAWLYEWARFSVNEVSASMREQALEKLIALREGTRVAA